MEIEHMFTVKYHHLVVARDIPKLGMEIRRRVRATIEEKLTTYPETFGAPLRRSLKGYRKLRIGNYRVIFKIDQAIVYIYYSSSIARSHTK